MAPRVGPWRRPRRACRTSAAGEAGGSVVAVHPSARFPPRSSPPFSPRGDSSALAGLSGCSGSLNAVGPSCEQTPNAHRCASVHVYVCACVPVAILAQVVSAHGMPMRPAASGPAMAAVVASTSPPVPCERGVAGPADAGEPSSQRRRRCPTMCPFSTRPARRQSSLRHGSRRRHRCGMGGSAPRGRQSSACLPTGLGGRGRRLALGHA